MADSSFVDMKDRTRLLTRCESQLLAYYQKGERTETTRKTAVNIQVSRTTVTNARRVLEDAGLIECEQGRWRIWTVKALENCTVKYK